MDPSYEQFTELVVTILYNNRNVISHQHGSIKVNTQMWEDCSLTVQCVSYIVGENETCHVKHQGVVSSAA